VIGLFALTLTLIYLAPLYRNAVLRLPYGEVPGRRVDAQSLSRGVSLNCYR
jgi:hypothetical protein